MAATAFDVTSGRQLWSYGPIGVGVAFSPDGKTVAIGLPTAPLSSAGAIALIDATTGRVRSTFPSSPNNGFEFAAGGKWFVNRADLGRRRSASRRERTSPGPTRLARALRHGDVPTDR